MMLHATLAEQSGVNVYCCGLHCPTRHLRKHHREQHCKTTLVMSESTRKSWRKRPKQSRSENTANSILTAAEEVFARRGFHDTTSEEIARRAGVGVGSLYDYFSDKSAIALALVERTALSVAHDSRKLLVDGGKEPIEKNLPKVIRELYQSYKQHRNILINLVAQVPELQAGGVYRLDRLLHRPSLLYLQLFRDQYPDMDIDTTHAFVFHIFTSSVTTYLASEEPPLSEEAYLTRLSGLLVGYLLNPNNSSA